MKSKSLLCLALVLSSLFSTANCNAANLPPDVISSAKFLFALGLPDPRGCDYRSFETLIRIDEYSSNFVEAHGWTLPAQPKSNGRFAIGWNGVVYPVIRLGPKADLQQDVKALLQIERLTRQEASTNKLFYRWPTWNQALWEDYSISQTNPTVIKVLFLARLGKVKLAREYWNDWCAVQTMNETPQEKADHFYEFAYAWSATLFERAVCAHMDGDDDLAVTELHALTRIRPELEREAARRGFTHPFGVDCAGQTEPIPYFYFLEPVPALLADEERRLKESPRETALQVGLDKFPDKSKRIAALISNLDQIALRAHFMDQWVGTLNLHPTVEALIAQGDEAVEPLIECMENDQRLTRSVNFVQSLDEVGNIYSVSNAAQAALDGILKMRFDTAAEYQAYWQKYKSLTQADRWCRALGDDQAGRKQWMQAADNILSRTDGKYAYLWLDAPAPNATNGYTYIAESLRSKANPSVSDLLAKRALEIAPTNYLSSEDSWAFDDATTLALMLAEWDPKGAVPVLKKTILHCPLFYVYPGEDWDSSDAEEDLATLVVALAQLGDNSGLDNYVKWLDSQSFSNIENALPKVLLPLGLFPNYPPIKEISVKLFQPGKDDWLNGASSAYDLSQTHLIQNGAYRSLVLKYLTNTDKCGTITLNQGKLFDITDLRDSFSEELEPDTFAPRIVETVSFRICDHVAWRLSRIENLPHFELYWPQTKRDAAIAGIIKFLKENGSHLQLKSPWWPSDD